MPDWLTPCEAAVALGVPPQTIEDLVDRLEVRSDFARMWKRGTGLQLVYMPDVWHVLGQVSERPTTSIDGGAHVEWPSAVGSMTPSAGPGDAAPKGAEVPWPDHSKPDGAMLTPFDSRATNGAGLFDATPGEDESKVSFWASQGRARRHRPPVWTAVIALLALAAGAAALWPSQAPHRAGPRAMDTGNPATPPAPATSTREAGRSTGRAGPGASGAPANSGPAPSSAAHTEPAGAGGSGNHATGGVDPSAGPEHAAGGSSGPVSDGAGPPKALIIGSVSFVQQPERVSVAVPVINNNRGWWPRPAEVTFALLAARGRVVSTYRTPLWEPPGGIVLAIGSRIPVPPGTVVSKVEAGVIVMRWIEASRYRAVLSASSVRVARSASGNATVHGVVWDRGSGPQQVVVACAATDRLGRLTGTGSVAVGVRGGGSAPFAVAIRDAAPGSAMAQCELRPAGS